MAFELTTAKPAKPSFLGPPAYILAAIAVLGAAVFYYFQFMAKAPAKDLELTPEAKAYVRNLQLADVEMKASESYFKQVVVELTGKIGNQGDQSLEVVEIYCVFHDSYGQTVLRKRVPIVSARMGGLKAGETKSFRLAFDELPDSWNHAAPSLVIAGIKFS